MAVSTFLTSTFLDGTPALSQASIRQSVCDETINACVTLDGLEAIILTGSMARDEASFVDDDGTIVVRGDAEFLLVFPNTVAIPSAQTIELQTKGIESRLIERNVRCKICLSPVSTAFLEGIVPHIFGYELRQCGQVLWGDRNALKLIPAFDANEIPIDDAVRLLCNRIVELLEAVGDSGPTSKRTQYATVKLYLDMATSFLVFAGGYRPTYRDRLEEIKNAKVTTVDPPFSLTEFVQFVDYSTQIKLSCGPFPSGLTTDSETREYFLTEAIRFAHLLLKWELQQLLKLDGSISDEDLLARWANAQPWNSRLRGWARVLRDAGTTVTGKNWARWLWLARRTSPRHGIYSAACLLLFQVPKCLQDGQKQSFKDLNGQLPICMKANEKIEWRSLAALIASNYHQFLEFTRT